MKTFMVCIIYLLFLFVPVYSENTNTGETSISNTNEVFLQKFYEQEKAGEERIRGTGVASPFWTTVKVIIYTAIFAAGAYFLIRFILAKGTLPNTEDEKIVEIILTRPLGMGAYIQIIKVGTSYYLLSLSGEGAHLIDRITDKETIDYIELNKETLKPKTVKFFDFLSFFPKAKNIDKIEFLKNQKDRLKKL